MLCKISVNLELSGAQTELCEEFELPLVPDRPGISLQNSKSLLKQLQRLVVNAQAEEYAAQHRQCPECGIPRRIKGHRSFQYLTLFGIVVVDTPRLYECRCSGRTGTFSLLNDWC